MTELERFVLSVHDADLDTPVPNAGALLKRALELGLVTAHAPLRRDGKDRARPVTITAKGIGYLRAQDLIALREASE